MLSPFLFALLLFSPPPQAPPAEQGQAIYRSNCAFCHGITGMGGRGPELLHNTKSDDEIKRIVKNGVPGTTMPSFGGFEEDELNKIVAFIRQLGGSAPAGEKLPGDSLRGKDVYAKNGCANCHQIGHEGSTYGPELTRIGGARPARYIRESITDPSNDIPPEYEGVTVTTMDGRKVQGVRINQSQFSVQLRLPSQQFRSFVIGKDAKEVTQDKKSLMPAYKLPKNELDDLVAYLAVLRGAASGQTKAAEGIK